MAKVIVLDPIAQDGLNLLTESGLEFEIAPPKLKGEELRAALANADGAICRSGVKITAESMAGNKRLKAIVRAGVGTDNIDKAAATRLGIVVMNTPTGNTVSTAEHAFAMILALSRHIAPANQRLVEGVFDRKSFMGSQLANKTLGIVGLGRIGQEVAKRAIAFDMKVIGFDPFLSPEHAAKLGVKLVERVETMLPEVDYLTVHTPKTPETENLIDTPQLKMMKPTARLINCARGGIYNEQALAEGLKNKDIAGVALDVYDVEPCTDSPLFGMPGTVCTPHLGASTEEAQTLVAVEAVQLLVDFFASGAVRHSVNMSPVDPETLSLLRGHLDLAYRLGLLVAQWHGASVSSCSLQYRGQVADQDTRLLTSSFCAGLLARALDEPPNIVNAEMLLKERGIELTQQCQSGRGPFRSSIGVEVQGDGRSCSASGTLFGANMPRLIRLGEYRLEAYLDGNLLIFAHEDVPGIIGAVGKIFGDHQINIAQMSVGRAGTQQGGLAIGVLNLDEIPPQAALDRLAENEHLHRCNVIELPGPGELPPWLET
jgi:D-3-phosphoglycerate dehydrogenase